MTKIIKGELEAMRRESMARRIKHPRWPSHRPALYHPNGAVEVFETMPIGKARGVKGYCKYCYTTHRDWWAMDPRETIHDDPGDGLMLCGKCEHTSLQSMIEV